MTENCCYKSENSWHPNTLKVYVGADFTRQKIAIIYSKTHVGTPHATASKYARNYHKTGAKIYRKDSNYRKDQRIVGPF